jgi:DNA-binding LytR/AlgR family response regulator
VKKSKILIVEDEPIIASDIEMTLEDLGYEVTAVVDNAPDAMHSLAKNTPDLVLLDINIEGDSDGIMLAEDINKEFAIPLVFLTSNADKVTINRVKRTNPAGFIVKPFSEQDLRSNIEIALFSKPKEQIKPTAYFFIKDGGSLVKVKIETILFAKADDNYTRLFTTEKSYLLSFTLKKIVAKLPENMFMRIHRSFIININYIDRIKDSHVYIEKHKLPIGRSYHDDFFNLIRKL